MVKTLEEALSLYVDGMEKVVIPNLPPAKAKVYQMIMTDLKGLMVRSKVQ